MQEAAETAEWPERFVYVCSAGGAINVNIAPAVQAGLGRIAGLVVGQGKSEPNRSTLTDRAQAEAPTQAILDFFATKVPLASDRMKVWSGHGDLVSPWTGMIDAAVALARKVGAPAVVFNLSGGRKPMTLGGFLAAIQGSYDLPVAMLTVGHNMFTLRLVTIRPGGGVNERPLPAMAHMTLEQYLDMYALEPSEPNRGPNRIARIENRSDALDVIAGNLGDADLKDDLGILNDRLAQNPALPATVSFPRNRPREITRRLFGQLPGVAVQGTEVSINDHVDADLLRGFWLEALCLHSVTSALSGKPGVEIRPGFGFRRVGAAQEESEFDLLVFSRDRLALVECKAITTVRPLREAINKLAQYRQQLSGIAGHAWIVAPFLNDDQLNRYGLLDQARAGKVDILRGPQAVEKLGAAVAKAFGA